MGRAHVGWKSREASRRGEVFFRELELSAAQTETAGEETGGRSEISPAILSGVSLVSVRGEMAADWEGIHPRELRQMEEIRELDMEELNVETDEGGDDDEEEEEEEDEDVDFSHLLAIRSFTRSSLNASRRHDPLLL
jgi:hypothetical protein